MEKYHITERHPYQGAGVTVGYQTAEIVVTNDNPIVHEEENPGRVDFRCGCYRIENTRDGSDYVHLCTEHVQLPPTNRYDTIDIKSVDGSTCRLSLTEAGRSMLLEALISETNYEAVLALLKSRINE